MVGGHKTTYLLNLPFDEFKQFAVTKNEKWTNLVFFLVMLVKIALEKKAFLVKGILQL
jgi:hypothetical protein